MSSKKCCIYICISVWYHLHSNSRNVLVVVQFTTGNVYQLICSSVDCKQVACDFTIRYTVATITAVPSTTTNIAMAFTTTTPANSIINMALCVSYYLQFWTAPKVRSSFYPKQWWFIDSQPLGTDFGWIRVQILIFNGPKHTWKWSPKKSESI